LARVLRDTSTLLSELTNCAAVVLAPDNEALSVRSTMLVRLAPRAVLLVLVLSNGSVEKRTIEVGEDESDRTIEAAASLLQAHLAGGALAQATPAPASGDPATDRVTSACHGAIAGMRDPEDDHVFVGGASRMARAFDAVDTVRSVLSVLEESYVVVSLLHDALSHEKNVSIGGENGIGPLAECSVVVAPYRIDEDVSGTIGVLGPTRMNYPQALAAVAVVGQRLSRQLSSGER
jgi:heat-inducible transcriptional repressor